jgi:hypothetical protein
MARYESSARVCLHVPRSLTTFHRFHRSTERERKRTVLASMSSGCGPWTTDWIQQWLKRTVVLCWPVLWLEEGTARQAQFSAQGTSIEGLTYVFMLLEAFRRQPQPFPSIIVLRFTHTPAGCQHTLQVNSLPILMRGSTAVTKCRY